MLALQHGIITPTIHGATPLMLADRRMTWAASSTTSEPCEDAPLAQFLDWLVSGYGDVLLPIRSESVERYTSLGAGKYEARALPLRLPGLEVTSTAVIRLEALPTGLRYTTERVRTEYAGPLRDVAQRLPATPDISAFTELRGSNGKLSMEVDFRLAVPLPAWWPFPDGSAAVGDSLIREIVRRDTRAAVTRVMAEYASWRRREETELRVKDSGGGAAV